MDALTYDHRQMSDIPITITNEAIPPEPTVLQNEKIYQIQVGYKLFQLSGLLLSLDSPSYFTRWFASHGADATLFLDRDPKLFELIYNHLQGYHVTVQNAYEMMNLWLDSFYYGLTRLQRFLTECDIHCVVGSTLFKIPRELLGPGNLPNYFTLQYDNLLQNNVHIIEQRQLLRPAPQAPPCVANRLAQLFNDLLECLRGNFLVVTDDKKRLALLKECRYYRFLELEQQLIKHKIVNDPFEPRQQIIIELRDLQQKGLVHSDPDSREEHAMGYQRPFIHREPVRTLLMQLVLDDNHVQLVLNRKMPFPTLYIGDRFAKKMTQVFKPYLTKFEVDDATGRLIFPVSLKMAKCIINGMEMSEDWANDFMRLSGGDQLKRRKVEGDIMYVNLTRSLWRIITLRQDTRLHAVALEGCTKQSSFILTSIDFL